MNNITVTLVYAASSTKQFLREVIVSAGSTILDVINTSGVCKAYPEINLDINKVGIASQVQSLATIVHANDRVEIYRPLIFDPMSARRLRAKGLRPSQSVPDASIHQKTPSNDAVQPNPHGLVTDKHNPNDPD